MITLQYNETVTHVPARSLPMCPVYTPPLQKGEITLPVKPYLTSKAFLPTVFPFDVILRKYSPAGYSRS